MPQRNKSKHSRFPFYCCSLYHCMLAAAHAEGCAFCHTDRVYLADSDELVCKRRAAKLSELQHKLSSNELVFELCDIHTRTAKHKHASSKGSSTWTPDTGATVTVCNRLDLFETIEDYKPNKRVRVANKQHVQVELIGTIRLTFTGRDGNPYTILLRNVHYSPHFSSNLLSVDELYRQHKITAKFGQSCDLITRSGVHIPIPKGSCNEYLLRAYAVSQVDAELWHRRFMHVGLKAMHNMQKCVHELGITLLGKTHKCDACCRGGMRKLHFGPVKRHISPEFRKHPRFTKFGQRIASDLAGPFPKGASGEKYAIIFHDSYSKYIAVYTIPDKTKETVLAAFQRFISDHHELLPNGVGQFWTDNGGEYLNADMDQFCEEICVKRSYTVPYAPPQNPYAERAWGTVMRKVRTALVDSKAPERFWPQAIQQAALIHNILCNDECISPYSKVYGKHFEYSRLHAWGCLCYYMVPERDRESKLSPTSMPAYYLGCDPERNGHIVYVPGLQRLTTGHHIVFNESRKFADDTSNKRVTFDSAPQTEFTPVGTTRRHYIEDTDDTPAQTQENNEAGENHPFGATQQHLPTTNTQYSPAADMQHGNENEWNENHCENSRCIYPRGHDGPCSHEEVTSRFRPQRGRRIYAECASDCCAFIADHTGVCEDRDGRELQCTEQHCEACDDSDMDDSDSGDYISVID